MTLKNKTNGKTVTVPKKDFDSWSPEMKRKFQVISTEDTVVKEEVVIAKKTTPSTGAKK